MDSYAYKTINQSEVKQFWDNGALLASNYFSSDELLTFRKKIETALTDWRKQNLTFETPEGSRLKTDLLANPLMQTLLLDARIVALAKSLLGTDPFYFGDSTFALGPTGRGWHRDNRNIDRNVFSGEDWQGHYPLIRIAVYLQDHQKHSGGLGIRLGSHQPVDHRLMKTKWLPRKARSFLANHTGRPIHMDSRLGDIVIWTLRTLHSADAVRLKWFPALRLPPLVEDRLPSWARVASDGVRMACFMTFAADSPHLHRYLEYLTTREYMLDMWKSSRWDAATKNKAKAAGIVLMDEKINELLSSSYKKNKKCD